MAQVELLHSMGDDLMVVNAARVSFAKESSEFKEQDTKLINYLAKHNHISPFFHPQIQFRIKMPIFVAREWYRHCISFSRSEISRRYVDSDPEFFIPDKSEMRERNSSLKQGSKDTPVDTDSGAYEIYKEISEKTGEAYKKLLELKVAPELARGVLAQNMYTELQSHRLKGERTKEGESAWWDFINKYKKLTESSVIKLRFKRDSKGQLRIQSSFSSSDFTSKILKNPHIRIT
jgi:thymidylate synthase (FAD)